MSNNFQPHPNCTRAKLVEDFIVTAKTTKQSYIRVDYNVDGYSKSNVSSSSDTSNFPLVLVPTMFWIFPLKKGAVVWVFNPSEAPTAASLYSVDVGSNGFNIPDSLLNDVTMPDNGSLVSLPSAPENVSVMYFTDNFWIIAGDTATLLKSGNNFTLYATDRIVNFTDSGKEYSTLAGTFNLEVSGLTSILASGGFSLKSTSKFLLQSNSIDLKNIIAELFTLIEDLYTKMSSMATDMASLAGTVAAGAAIDPPLAAAAAQAATEATLAGEATAQNTVASTYKTSNVDVFFQET